MHWPYSVSAAEFLSTLPARGATCWPSGLPPVRSVFLSTLPARGATVWVIVNSPINAYFYPRSPRGERLQRAVVHLAVGGISIHAPREGSD